ncbi:hypothetical protein [Rhodopirellula baltica]|uniref:hypothetical protein n=1 Tax=Rhodopirellula baltica TaxID=265606 RepID=UPI001F2FAB6A|nr:hypothetical protein [Rhodopirellula baltica]
MRELLLELDAAYSGISLDAAIEADHSYELTCIEICVLPRDGRFGSGANIRT